MAGQRVGYVRVSTVEQNTVRQLDGIELDRVFTDHISGATRNRPALDRANAVAIVGYPTARRADPPNSAPTVKALLDGAVDAGLLPDDDHRHVPRTSYERGPDTRERGVYLVTIRLEPLP